MQCWHRRVGHGALSSGSWSIPQPQLTLSRQSAHTSKRHGMHSSQQKQRMLGFSGVDPSSTKPSSGVATNAHRTAVSLHQRPRHTQEHSNHGHNHHHRQLKDDGSLKIIMLLSLSLTLLLLPWVAHHPEFLIAPLLLAVTPVVGNGVRPVLKEVAAGLLSALKLMGMAAWYDVTHELPQHQHHNHSSISNGGNGSSHHLEGAAHHNHSSSSSSQQQQQQQYSRDPTVYQQQLHHLQQQHPQPDPSGPHSPWPNPAYTPAGWPSAAAAPQQQQQQHPASPAPPSSAAAAAGALGSHAVSHPLGGDDADVDWSLSDDWSLGGPPDPHREDPLSLQHLRQVLEADLQTEAELGRQEQQQQRGVPHVAGSAAAAAATSSSRSLKGASPRQGGSPVGSPTRGSPAASIDAADFGQQQQAAIGSAAADHQHHQHFRDPRVLSKQAKQQLYQNHKHQQQQQQH